ncbi:MAG: GMC family oxidoreductase [Kordiimonadaceae bacterium]|nr:GMC family oxidoreductase [Kordiimonadaceae bacterium]
MANETEQPVTQAVVLIVGSGAGGGMMAYQLATSGVKVTLLESGRMYDSAVETAMFSPVSDAPLRDMGTPDKPAGFFDATIGGGSLEEEPFTTDEGTEFRWWRARMMGGRTHHWGRQTPRYGPDDFKVFSNTGREVDWPVSYEDVAPYYDRVEEIVGVLGPDEKEAVHNSPVPPNHIRHEPPAPRASEMLFAKACEKIGLKTHAHPTAILTRDKGDRSACFYATNCIRGCSIGAAFDSVTGFIQPALKTGNLTIISHAHVLQVLTDASGKKATGVLYVDRETETRREVQAKVVVLAAGSMQSCRIMLNSATDKAPEGLGNSSGMLGKYVSDTLFTNISVQLPTFVGLPPHNEDGISNRTFMRLVN